MMYFGEHEMERILAKCSINELSSKKYECFASLYSRKRSNATYFHRQLDGLYATKQSKVHAKISRNCQPEKQSESTSRFILNLDAARFHHLSPHADTKKDRGERTNKKLFLVYNSFFSRARIFHRCGCYI